MKTPGKINHSFLDEMIMGSCGYTRKEVSTGPGFGVDVAVVDLPNGLAMAATSDPLSLIPTLGLEESAWLSVHLMANDMATTGFAPMYAQFVLNLPVHLSRQDFKTYWNYIHQFCNNMGTAITGGHTGFIADQHSTIAGGGTFTTIAPKSQVLTSRMAQPSNVILATKQCALTATSILAMSFPKMVKNKLGNETFDKSCSLFYQTSSLKDAIIAAGKIEKHQEITAMHDVTEGGMLGAIYELAVASGTGAIIYNDQIPVGDIQEQVCQLFSIDPRYCVGAGSMIIACEKGKENLVIERLRSENIACVAVGELTNQEAGINLIANGNSTGLTYYETDPYWSAFFNALKSGWK